MTRSTRQAVPHKGEAEGLASGPTQLMLPFEKAEVRVDEAEHRALVASSREHPRFGEEKQ